MARVTLKELQEQLAEISRRIAALEPHGGEEAAAPAQAAGVEAPGISEEELLAISAAIGAYLGVRAHIRQIRLVSTSAWAQQGRVSIQASHRLQG
jgi:methylmalonyl-CoA carboxyltransferase large subunit